MQTNSSRHQSNGKLDRKPLALPIPDEANWPTWLYLIVNVLLFALLHIAVLGCIIALAARLRPDELPRVLQYVLTLFVLPTGLFGMEHIKWRLLDALVWGVVLGSLAAFSRVYFSKPVSGRDN